MTTPTHDDHDEPCTCGHGSLDADWPSDAHANCDCLCDDCLNDSCRSCGTNHYTNPNCSECRDTQDISTVVRTVTEALAPTEADLAGICPTCHGCGTIVPPPDRNQLGTGFETCPTCAGKGVTR